MFINDIEYISLRLVRKYIFTNRFLSKYGRFVPYYKVTPSLNSPVKVVKDYLNYLKDENVAVTEKSILEVGVGVTNCSCYELAARGARYCFAYEPLAGFEDSIDKSYIETNPHCRKALDNVERLSQLDSISDGSIDIILSNRVLEYVYDMEGLCRKLNRLSNENTVMVHTVDYLDHFYKYKFHHYKFSKSQWKLIDPGLSRLRISDHIESFEKHGFEVKVKDINIDLENFYRFKKSNNICKEFSHYSDEELATTYAVLIVRKKQINY